MTQADVSIVVEVKPCLAALSLATILTTVTQRSAKHDAGNTTTLWLNDLACADCPIGSVQQEISRITVAVNRLLAAFGEEPRVLTYRDSPSLLAESTSKRPVVQSHRPRFTRRDLFRSLTDPAADESPADLETEEEGARHLRESRGALMRSLKRMDPPIVTHLDVTALPFGSICIEGKCVACGLCARMCPSAALSYGEHAGTFSISFSAAACLDCAICTLICPTNAVALKAEVEIDHLLEGTPITLATGDLTECRECGMPCAADHAEPLCFVCQWRCAAQATDVYGRPSGAQLKVATSRRPPGLAGRSRSEQTG